MFGFKPFNIFYGGVDSVTYGGYILVDDILFSSYAPTGHGTVYVYADTTTNSVSREPGTTTATFTLLPNYPNPFNAQTTLPFTLDRAGKVEIDIFDITGRSVGAFLQTPLHGWYSAGTHEFVWNAEGMSSGVYLLRLSVDGSQFPVPSSRTAVEKVVLVK